MSRPTVLFVSHDAVGTEMAGLGIRYYELARALADTCDVAVAHGGTQTTPHGGVALVPFRPHAPAALRPALQRADMVVSQPVWPTLSAMLRRSGARVVHDLYDPETLETLELFRAAHPRLRRLHTALTLDRLEDALRTGHHFVCASEKQRDLWLGAMLARRMVDPSAYDADPSFRSIIDVVPFGLGDAPRAEQLEGPGARQAFPGISDADEIVLWNGGIWRWLDASSAIRAVAALAASRPTVRLVFMGGSSQPAARAATEEARSLASALDVLDRHVFFNDGWVPYAARGGWLAQASCVLSTAPDHLETRFAFRTRLLDAFWAGVPVVCTRGDALADAIERAGLGATVAPGDVTGLEAALSAQLDTPAPDGAAFRAVADAYRWRTVASPLRTWAAEARAGHTRHAKRGGSTGWHAVRSTAYAAGLRQFLNRAGNGSGPTTPAS